jgi:GntR family transcriptional regulator
MFDNQTGMTMSKSSSAPVFKPLYEQIKVFLTQSLIAGEWKPGESIPSEIELAARFNVSQGTVRKAIDALAMENILIRRQGKGTFVATHKEEQSKLRFLRLTAADGYKQPLNNRMLECKRLKADNDISQLTGLKKGTAVIEIQRLLMFSDAPKILDYIIVQSKFFRGLNSARISEHNGSLYSMYETVYGIPMVRAEEKLTAVAATPEQARMLDVEPGFPLLRVERVAFTYGDKPMEWRVGLCVTDEHHYMNELE